MKQKVLKHIFEILKTIMWFTILPTCYIINFLERKVPTFNIDRNYKITEYQYSYLIIVPWIKVSISFLLSIIIETLTHNKVFSSIVFSTIYIGLSGGIHFDALCDCIDTLYANKLNLTERYKVMKDPHIGALGLFWSVLITFGTGVGLYYLRQTFNTNWGAYILLCLSVITPYISIQKALRYYYTEMCYTLSGKRFSKLEDVNVSFYQNKPISNKSFIFLWLVFGGILIIMFNFWFPSTLEEKLIIIFLGFTLFQYPILSRLYLYSYKKMFGFFNGDCLGFSISITECVHTLILSIFIQAIAR